MKKVDYKYATPFGELNDFLAFCAKMKKKVRSKYEKKNDNINKEGVGKGNG